MIVLLVDGLNLIRRVHAGVPSGESSLAATIQSLRRALRDLAPTHAVVVFEGEGPTFRHRLYPQYKAGRKPMPEDLRRDLDQYREEFRRAGVPSESKPGTEADDVIATLATGVAARGGRAIVLSTDSVFCQLLSDRITVRDHFQQRALDRAHVLARFGVEPERLVDLWALAGSPTTHIPGVPGVGLKTAAKLLAAHGDLDRVLEAAAGMEGKVGEALRANKELARLSRDLARLQCELELGWNLRSFRYHYNNDTIR